MIPAPTDNPTPPDPRWLCEATTNGIRCTLPATSGGYCPAHHPHRTHRSHP